MAKQKKAEIASSDLPNMLIAKAEHNLKMLLAMFGSSNVEIERNKHGHMEIKFTYWPCEGEDE